MVETILVADPDPSVRTFLAALLGDEGYRVEEARSIVEARSGARGARPALVLIGPCFPDARGLERLHEWNAPVVLMTGDAPAQGEEEAVRQGAQGHLRKPLRPAEVLAIVARVASPRSPAWGDAGPRGVLDSILAKSRAMRSLLADLRAVAGSPAATVLLLGETGTGKSVLARALHEASPRSGGPFLTVTCSAIPETLLEAELFGHERGAFTDAKSARPGVFEAADGGTLFLDEIGDMPLNLQSKLLGVLEERSFRRVGATRTTCIDVRIVAATHRDLEALVEQGRFRMDLLYRLAVVPLEIPPLRERPEDIAALARAFLLQLATSLASPARALADEALRHLEAHSWPGNVRELRNAIERAVVFARGPLLGAADVPLRGWGRPEAPPTQAPAPTYLLPAEGISLARLEESLVQQALARAGGVKSHAAKILGLSRDQIRLRLSRMRGSRARPAPEVGR
ncbi:MAG: sigma-54-dependent transcriptional regulator [Planctomycetaceae bacterium]